MGFAIDRVMPADHHVLIVQIIAMIINSRLQIIIWPGYCLQSSIPVSALYNSMERQLGAWQWP